MSFPPRPSCLLSSLPPLLRREFRRTGPAALLAAEPAQSDGGGVALFGSWLGRRQFRLGRLALAYGLLNHPEGYDGEIMVALRLA